MSSDTISSPASAASLYSRLPANLTSTHNQHRAPAKATRTQSLLEKVLFAVFGSTILLAAVALYITNTPEHRMVPNKFAAGVKSDRVNVLLIETSVRANRPSGMGDVSTESIMMLSIQPSTGKSVLMSIPADLWVKVGRYGERPLRAAHMVGDSSGYPGEGAGLTVDTVEQSIGQPIHAYAAIDIGDVKRLVDSIGGVDVNVEQGLYDFKNRDRFVRGEHHLNGVRALRYAHSQNVVGPAADRFARESRQQQLFAAALTKVATLRDVTGLGMALDRSHTNLTREQVTMLRDVIRSHGLQRVSLEPYMDIVEVSGVAYRGEAVSPHGGDFDTVRHFAGTVFNIATIQ
ncbi:MAG TPA: LCP family protein [Thermoanaerobaculia bacterium]|nr:LCP family protein [Thermoanaerobaculia bacterium]